MKKLLTALCVLLVSCAAFAQVNYQPNPRTIELSMSFTDGGSGIEPYGLMVGLVKSGSYNTIIPARLITFSADDSLRVWLVGVNDSTKPSGTHPLPTVSYDGTTYSSVAVAYDMPRWLRIPAGERVMYSCNAIYAIFEGYDAETVDVEITVEY